MKKARNPMLAGMLMILAGTFILTAAGCGRESSDTKMEEEVGDGTEQEVREKYLTAEESADVPMVVVEYAQTEKYPSLAEFLAYYYQIPENLWTETRYYYHYVDLNADGIDEIFAVVISEEMTAASGDPGLILQKDDTGNFMILEDFERVHTPITICESETNGWKDIILKVYGDGEKNGFLCRSYVQGRGYQAEDGEFFEEMPKVSGTQILSNNLIDDMDKGSYLTIAAEEE